MGGWSWRRHVHQADVGRLSLQVDVPQYSAGLQVVRPFSRANSLTPSSTATEVHQTKRLPWNGWQVSNRVAATAAVQPPILKLATPRRGRLGVRSP